MLYVICGTDRDKTREKAVDLRGSLLKKRPDASLFTLEPSDVSADRLDELSSSQGLFENKYIVFADRLFEDEEVRQIFLDRLDSVATSPNIFILLEGKITKDIERKLENHICCSGGSPEIFALADALGKKDTKSMWVLYRKALDNNDVPEEIHGILWWQLKSIALAQKCKNAAEAGINPFVYSKSKGFSKNFKLEEIDRLLSRMVSIYHEAHRGIADFEIALEKFVLDLK